MRRTASIPFAVITFSVALLIASGYVVLGQDNGNPQTLESVKSPEALLQEALTDSATKDREIVRLRLSEAMKLWIARREPEKAARAVLQLGDAYKRGRKYQDSLYYYKLALEVPGLPNHMKAIAYNSIAQIFWALFKSDLSLSYYLKAAEQEQRAKQASAQIVTLTGLAEYYWQQRETEKALTYIKQAQNLNRPQKDELAEAALLRLIGQINQEKGQIKEARAAFEQALAVYSRKDEEGTIKILCLISRLCLSSGQKELALAKAGQAVELAEKQAQQAATNGEMLRARDMQWGAWLSQARAQRAMGQTEPAIKSFKRAIHHLEGLWWLVYVSTENSAIRFREELQAPYRELVDLLIDQKRFEEAYDWAEHAKAHATMGFIKARRRADLPQRADPDGKIRDSAKTVARLRTQLLFANLSAEKKAKLKAELTEAEYRMDEARLLAEMEQARERISWSQPATIKLLQKKMLQENETLLEFFTGEERSFAWLVTRNEVSLAILPSRKEIEKAIRQYLELVTSPPSNIHLERDLTQVRERAEQLFSILFDQLSKRISPGQKLIIVPDGVLHYLPFESLIRNGRYLVEGHDVRYLPSASLLEMWSGEKNNPATAGKMELLAFADPIFGPESKKSVQRQALNKHLPAAGQRQTLRGFQLAPLPQTHEEAEYISTLFPTDRQHIYMGSECLEEVVKQTPLRGYRRLHFATHGFVDAASPSRSAVVLTLDDDPDEDGLLEVGEILELDLDCELVVLSACQTGQGQLLSGEGVIGLCHAFLCAGAQSVVVSLWNVNDISTAQMMKTFYQKLVDNNGNAAALRQAKLRMLESGTEMRHPYYWAAFTLIGNP
ncbi:MAG TPA: CHAT domain-containing tetratricopeptide repeat protein [Blastocatellia bacterium]|nr:CHAT domain-containing tetratricopeptide repeat protein [Blastocatellia bacterium]